METIASTLFRVSGHQLLTASSEKAPEGKRNFPKAQKRIKSMRLTGKALMLTLLIMTRLFVSAQSNQLETDEGIAASIAPYDADVRQAILQVSQYPQVLATLQKNQAQTVAAFQDAISGFAQKKQGWFYTLTRYPDLTHTLATLPAKQSEESVYALLPNQDADLKEASWELYKNHQKDLVKIDQMQASAQQDFNKTIQGLDAPTTAAFKKLSNMPDVLTLLTNNIDLTTRLGQHYKSNPVQVNSQLTALHDSLNVQNQYEVTAFKKQMDDDPKAAAELNSAVKDYAKENGYDMPTQQDYNMNNTGYYYNNPYSYWFGYPVWYSAPLWYPRTFWYGSGFYMGLGGFGWYGFPSYGFSTWFYNRGYYSRYPHLYRQFGNYYHTTIYQNRVVGGVNHGFMRAADSHYNPSGEHRINQLTSPSSYHRPTVSSYQSGWNTPHNNANAYHAQSWGSYGGRGNAVGGGGFHGGGGGGGFHGGHR